MSVLVGSGRFAALDSYENDGGLDVATVRLTSGGLAVVWISGGTLIGYVVDANGNGGVVQSLGEAFDKMTGDLYDVSLTALPNGGIAAAWVDLDGNIKTRAFDATLAPTGGTQMISADAVSGPLGQPSLAALQSGFVMAYVANDASGEGIRAQIYGPTTGTFVGPSFAVNTATTGNQELPIALALSNGGFLISWADDGGNAYAGQFYTAAGQPVGGQVTLAPGGDSVYDITALSSGNIVIVWPSADGEIKGQVYTVTGVKVGAEFQVNTPTAGIEMMPDITALDDGGFAVAWASPVAGGGSAIHAQLFSANGTAAGAEIVVSEGGLANTFPRITGFGTGDLTVSWIQVDEADPGEFVTSTMSRLLYSAVQGTGGVDLMVGTSSRDFFFGFAGDDQLSGGDANDELHGDAGNDTLNGDAGNDTIDGGTGNDVINTGSSPGDPFDGDLAWGGSGADQITGGNGWDTLYSDQREDPEHGYFSFNINFPEFYNGPPTLDRGTDVDIISAGGGDDFVSIGYGDSADGGSQSGGSIGDQLMVSFFAAPSGVTADFRSPTINVGGGVITGFEWIEYVEGSQFNDVFTFNSFLGSPNGAFEVSTLGGDDQVIAGYSTTNVWAGDGNDVVDGSASQYLSYVSGGAGNDTITGSARPVRTTIDGGDGDDVIHGGIGDEIVIGGAGNDTIDGGAGTDRAEFGSAANGVNVALATSGPQNTNQGIDTISNVEDLWGSAYADTLGGNAANNDIRGGAGDDWLYGGAGGNDTIYGEDGNDTLDGRGGAAAYLYGGSGNDTYYIDGDDVASEFAPGAGSVSGGIDQVYSSVTYTLGAAIENLTLTGTAAIDGTGNGAANIIIGNGAANAINGSTGLDTLTGGLGADTLTGGSQLDTFRDTAAGLNGDTITDLVAGEKIIITDATLAGFSASLSNNVLTYTGGSVTLSNVANGTLSVSAAAGGGVQLMLVGHDVRNDINGDRRSDMIVRDSQSGWLTDWLGVQNGALTSNSANLSVQFPLDWNVVGAGDYNGDTRDDLLLRNDAGWLTNWLGTATGGLTNNGANTSLFFTPDWKIVSTGDFNGDNITDILLRRDDGWVTNWLGNSSGGFTNNGANTALFFTTDWKVIGTGDVNGDGKDDLVLRRDDGWITDWLGTSTGSFTNNGANTALFLTTDWKIASIADINGDNREDILLRNDGGWLTDWLGTTTGSFTPNSFSTFLAPNWVVQDPFL